DAMLERAIELHGEELIDNHIATASGGAKTLNSIQVDALVDVHSIENRKILGKAARTRKAGWFKSISWMEDLSRDIVGPHLSDCDPGFCALVEEIFTWASDDN